MPAGVEIHALAPASFRGAVAVALRAPFALGTERARNQAYYAWVQVAAQADFPAGGPDMMLGVADDAVYVWKTSFGLGRPIELAGTFPIARIGAVAVVRHGLLTSIALALIDGPVIEFEAIRGRKLRDFARRLEATVTGRGRAP